MVNQREWAAFELLEFSVEHCSLFILKKPSPHLFVDYPSMSARPLFTFPLPSLLVCAAFLLTVGPARAQTGLDLGASSFQFLKLSLSPRADAMGGAGAALAAGPAEAEINPAVVAGEKGALALGQEYPPKEFGTRASSIGWSLPWDGYRVLLHARYLGFDAIPGWNSDNNATASYGAHTLKLQTGLAGHHYGFDWGGGAAYARNNIADATYSALLANAGVRRDLSAGFLPAGLSAGGSVVNVPLWAGKTQETGETLEPPTIWRAGVGYTRDLKPGSRVVVAVDARKTDKEDLVFPVGAEYRMMDALFLRAGYPVSDPDNGFSLGVGLKWSRFAFNYAYKHHATLSGGHGWTLEIGNL